MSIPDLVPATPQPPAHPALRVLIVDDSRPFRRVARELLEHRGYVVAAEASSASSAIRAVEACRPDAALVDIGLPDANGAELAAFLAARYPAIRVLLTSADPRLDGEKLVEQTHAAGFAPKSQLAKLDLETFWPKG